MAEYDTPPSDGESVDYTDRLFDSFTGGLETGIGKYFGALGARQDSFGQVQAGGTSNPSVQYTRNPLTGQLVNNSTGQPVGGAISGVPSWVVYGGGALLVAAVAFLALRR